MEKSRYFRSANKLNIVMNVLSGNVFPLGDEHTALSFISLLWIMLMWFTKITYFLTGFIGSLYMADLTFEDLFKKFGTMGVLCIEVMIPTIYLNLRRKSFRKLIQEYNALLIDSENLRRCVCDTVKPYKTGLKYYMAACIFSASTWSAAPILLIVDYDEFTYANFTVPAYYPGEPFGSTMFVVYSMFQVFGCCSIEFGRISVDMYVIHFIAVLSAQYKYISQEISKALRDDDGERDELSVIIALQNCVRHHCAVIKIGRRLAQLLALHIGATYFTCIFKFCFVAYALITLGSAIIDIIAFLICAFAYVAQIFLLCSSIEELLIRSTSVTEDAFHENWYGRSMAVKKTFCTIELTTLMECRLSAYGVVDLIVPTLALILSKSYSVCLLLLEVN